CNHATGSVRFTTIVSNSVSLTGSNDWLPTKYVGGGGISYESNTLSLNGVIFASNISTNAPQNIFGSPLDLGANISSDNSFAFSAPKSLTGVDPRLDDVRTF